MGFPSEKFEAAYRNPFPDVMNFLDTFHGNHYKVYNFCSERPYDGEHKIKGEYEYFPFDDHGAPKFEIIEKLCKDVDEFLSKDKRNVIALHCKAGKGRTGLMCSCLLMYFRDCLHSYEAVDLYGAARTYDKKGVTIPSQLKYVGYWGSTLLYKLPYGNRKLKLISISMSPVPKVNEDLRIKVHLWKTVQCDKPLGSIKQGKAKESKSKREADLSLFDKIYDELKKNKPDVSIREAVCAWDWKLREIAGGEKYGTDTATFNVENVNLVGDVKIEVYNNKLGQLFSFWFNTWFVNGTKLNLTKLELDKGCRDDKFLAPNFMITIDFEELDTQVTENSVPVSKCGINEEVTDAVMDAKDIPVRPDTYPADPNANPGEAVFKESWGEVPDAKYAPKLYPNYQIGSNFNLYQKVVDHLMGKFPELPLNQISDKKFKDTTRGPLEVSRSLLYAIITLYLRSGFYGRCNDIDIERIYFDYKNDFNIFEAQSTELAAVDLMKLKDEEKEPFWLNVYHTMLLHALIYMKHRPYPDHKELMSMFKKIYYEIDKMKYSLYEVLVGCLRAPFGKDDSLGSSVVFNSTNPRVNYVCKEVNKYIGFLINFGIPSSAPIWMYDVEDFAEQKKKCIDHFFATQGCAIQATKTVYIPSHLKMFTKDFKGEKNMTKEIYNIYKIVEGGWSLKWQSCDRECGVWLDHLVEEGITVTHRNVPYFAQSEMFNLQIPNIYVKPN